MKTTITETTKKYDKEGHLIEETTRTEITEDSTITYGPYVTTTDHNKNYNNLWGCESK